MLLMERHDLCLGRNQRMEISLITIEALVDDMDGVLAIMYVHICISTDNICVVGWGDATIDS